MFELASNMQADVQRLATQNRSLDEKAAVAKRTINRLSQQLAKLQQDNVQLASRIASIQNHAADDYGPSFPDRDCNCVSPRNRRLGTELIQLTIWPRQFAQNVQ